MVKLKNLILFFDYDEFERSQKKEVYSINSAHKSVINRKVSKVDLEQLIGDKSNQYFYEVLKQEFEKSIMHHYLLDSFSMEIRLSLNKNPTKN